MDDAQDQSPGATPAARPGRVRLIVEIDELEDVPRGTVADEDGAAVAFYGWTAMAAAIERWRVGRPGSERVLP